MIKSKKLFVLFLILFAFPVAADVPIVADLSSHLVKVSTSFTGADVLLFGATEGDGDVALVVRGEPVNYVVRKKEKQGLIWVNGEAVTFLNSPSFYYFAASQNPEYILPRTVLASNQLGLDNLISRTKEKQLSEGQKLLFNQALIDERVKKGIFNPKMGKIRMLENRLFSAKIKFPANAPIGSYRVETYLFKEGAIASAEISPLILLCTSNYLI